MSGLLQRLGEFFFAPAHETRTRSATTSVSASRLGAGDACAVALLAPAAEARSLGASLALAHAPRGIAVVAAWRVGGGARASAPAVAAARRLAASLVARELVATAAGRLVTVTLPDDEDAAVAALGPLEPALGSAPLVLALGGPRGEWWDGALARCSEVHVRAADPDLAALAVARLREQGIAASNLAEVPTGMARRLAGAGLALPGARAGLRPAAAGAGR